MTSLPSDPIRQLAWQQKIADMNNRAEIKQNDRLKMDIHVFTYAYNII